MTPDALVMLGSLTLLGVASVAGPDRAVVAGGAVLALVLVAAGTWRRATAARPVTVLTALVGLGSLLLPIWPIVAGAAIALLVGASRRVPSLAPGAGWFARGRIPPALTALSALVTPAGLLGWWFLLRPDVGDILATYVPDLPLPVLVAGGVVFAIANATFEEVIWRGILQERLAAVLPVPAAVGLQAVSFGLLHAHGFPRGVAGVVLAGLWAVLLGLLRARCGGLLAPILAHFVADAVIAGILLGLAAP